MRVLICSIVNVSVFDPDQAFKSALQTAGVGFDSEPGAAVAPEAIVKTKSVNASALIGDLQNSFSLLLLPLNTVKHRLQGTAASVDRSNRVSEVVSRRIGSIPASLRRVDMRLLCEHRAPVVISSDVQDVRFLRVTGIFVHRRRGCCIDSSVRIVIPRVPVVRRYRPVPETWLVLVDVCVCVTGWKPCKTRDEAENTTKKFLRPGTASLEV